MSSPSRTGTGTSPAADTAADCEGAHSTRASWPADCTAQPSGTIGYQCPGQAETVNSTRTADLLRDRLRNEESGEQPAVHHDLGTGDVRGVVAEQVRGQGRHLLGTPEPAQRQRPVQPAG